MTERPAELHEHHSQGINEVNLEQVERGQAEQHATPHSGPERAPLSSIRLIFKVINQVRIDNLF